jgi:DNA-binding CsgD family transcriptional regulator/GAF domain-containing protein
MVVSQVSRAVGTEDSALIERVESVVAAVADHLGLPLPASAPTALGRQLQDLEQRLDQRLAVRDPADDSRALAEHLTSVMRLRCELIDYELSRRVRCLSEIRNALASLRGMSPREMIYAAPPVLSRGLGFTRTMISTVRGSVWSPQRLYGAEDGGAESRRFHAYVDGAHIQLAHAPLETEVVRKRCGVFVPSPMEDKRTLKEIVEAANCFGYIAAPITVHNRTIGILHADRPEPHGMVTVDHLDQLETFAECLSVAFESAVLEEKATRQRLAVDNLCANVDGLLGPSGPSVPSARAPSAATPGGRRNADCRRDQPAVAPLTAREREIMSYVATGATNGQIARSLVISEGTVKSHLKCIAKKLNTPSRAAAVAVYAGLAAADAEGSR